MSLIQCNRSWKVWDHVAEANKEILWNTQNLPLHLCSFFFLSLVTILEQLGGDRDAEKDQAAAQTLPMFNVMKLITAWQIQ